HAALPTRTAAPSMCCRRAGPGANRARRGAQRLTALMKAAGERSPATAPRGGIDARQVRGGQADVVRRPVLLEVLAALRAGNRDDVLALREHPGQGELARRGALLARDRLDLRHEIEVLLEVFALEARLEAAVVVLREVLDALDLC